MFPSSHSDTAGHFPTENLCQTASFLLTASPQQAGTAEAEPPEPETLPASAPPDDANGNSRSFHRQTNPRKPCRFFPPPSSDNFSESLHLQTDHDPYRACMFFRTESSDTHSAGKSTGNISDPNVPADDRCALRGRYLNRKRSVPFPYPRNGFSASRNHSGNSLRDHG